MLKRILLLFLAAAVLSASLALSACRDKNEASSEPELSESSEPSDEISVETSEPERELTVRERLKMAGEAYLEFYTGENGISTNDFQAAAHRFLNFSDSDVYDDMDHLYNIIIDMSVSDPGAAYDHSIKLDFLSDSAQELLKGITTVTIGKESLPIDMFISRDTGLLKFDAVNKNYISVDILLYFIISMTMSGYTWDDIYDYLYSEYYDYGYKFRDYNWFEEDSGVFEGYMDLDYWFSFTDEEEVYYALGTMAYDSPEKSELVINKMFELIDECYDDEAMTYECRNIYFRGTLVKDADIITLEGDLDTNIRYSEKYYDFIINNGELKEAMIKIYGSEDKYNEFIEAYIESIEAEDQCECYKTITEIAMKDGKILYFNEICYDEDGLTEHETKLEFTQKQGTKELNHYTNDRIEGSSWYSITTGYDGDIPVVEVKAGEARTKFEFTKNKINAVILQGYGKEEVELLLEMEEEINVYSVKTEINATTDDGDYKSIMEYKSISLEYEALEMPNHKNLSESDTIKFAGSVFEKYKKFFDVLASLNIVEEA